jgi:glycosyltransferase A (GT-A) superfamily protein (DUF2064 family)
MRRIDLPTIKPANLSVEEWIGEAFAQINQASAEDTADAAAEAFVFDDADVTETTTFDPSTATATDVRNVLSTFLMYLRRGAPSKTQ